MKFLFLDNTSFICISKESTKVIFNIIKLLLGFCFYNLKKTSQIKFIPGNVFQWLINDRGVLRKCKTKRLEGELHDSAVEINDSNRI